MPHPEFPPLLKGHAINHISGDTPLQLSDLIAKAEIGANSGIYSAGDILWSTNQDRAECAIVLEPEVQAEQALEMLPLTMVAIADSLGAISPPNLAVTFHWPNIIMANGAPIGKVDLRLPTPLSATQIPDYAIVAISLAIKWPSSPTEHHPEPGDNPNRTVLHEEGCGELDRTLIIESLSRHFLSWIDSWEQEGFKVVFDNWHYRAASKDMPISININNAQQKGDLVGFDEKAGLFLKVNHDIKLYSLSDIYLSSET